MKKSDLRNIVVSFEMPKDLTITGYEFLKDSSQSQGGGLLDQVVMTYEKLSLEDIYDELVSFIEEGIPSEIEEITYSIIGAIVSIAWSSTSISLFPDNYKEIIDLIEETENGNILNIEKLNELIIKNKGIENILEELIKQNFLRKKKNGKYVVIKNVLTNTHISFLQIAD